jgi:hypothetical protein
MDDFKTPEDFKSSCGYEIEGAWYPRVTRIVEIKAKPALYRFYGKVSSFAEGERIKNNSAVEGTLIHETAEKIFLNQPVTIPESISASIDALKEFMSEKKIQVDPEYVEARLVNFEHRYAGTLDAIALIDGKLGVLDIKTSQEIYRDYNLQTAAYFAAMKDVVPGLETRWILRVDQTRPCLKCKAFLRSKGGRHQVKNGWSNGARECNHEWGALTGKVELKEFPLWEDDFSAFLGAKKLWEWENVNWLKEIGYLS